MKKFLFFPIFLLVLIVQSCQNNGNIGSLFGTWALTDLTINGETADNFDPERTTWSFQNNIVRIVYEIDYNSYDNRIGTWEKTSSQGKNFLDLNFTHSADGIQPGTGIYMAPQWLDFPANTIISFQYIKDSSREMILSRTDSQGNVYTYYLKKTW